jgi:tetratricopeptide (TPR) repeat protein
MPQRPKSHQLEDFSKKQFNKLIPSEWVVRDKSHDYGIDLEVEIFASDGSSTGLIFYVQLRATDDANSSRRLVIGLEQLKYFYSLKIPTMIVRYCRTRDTFFWRWHFNVMPSDKQERQSTMTIVFDNSAAWHDQSPVEVNETLVQLGLKSAYPPTKEIAIRWRHDALGINDRYGVDQAIDEIFVSAPILRAFKSDESGYIIVDLDFFQDKLVVSADCICSITLPVQNYKKDTLEVSLIYSITAVLQLLQLTIHAGILARISLLKNKAHPDRRLGFFSAFSLSSDLLQSVKLAILNGIPLVQDEFYLRYMAGLRTSSSDQVNKAAAIDLFFTSALQGANASKRSSTIAGVHYSWANFLTTEQKYASAVRHYNSAGRIWRKYLQADYFLNEVASCLYFSRKFECSVYFYSMSVNLNPTLRVLGCLGDAQLFAGKIERARVNLDCAIEQGSEIWEPETEIKRWLCHRLIARFGVDELPVRTNAAKVAWNKFESRSLEFAVQNVHEVLKVDALYPVAHFNLAMKYAKLGDHISALESFLVCALRYTFDLESWVNAIKCSANTGDAALCITVISAALRLCGKECYETFRKAIELSDESVVAAFDQIYRELSAEINLARPKGIELRLVPH